MHRKLLATGSLAALVLVAACDGSPAGPATQAGITPAEATALAPEYEEVTLAVFDGFAAPAFNLSPEEGAAAAVSTTTTTFTRTRECPRGGSVSVQGSIVVTRDPETRTGSRQFNATRTEAGCVFAARGGGTVTITGNPSTALTSSQSWTNGQPGVRTNTTKGSFTWQRSTGESGTCTVDLTSTFTPATRTHTLKGTFCNHTVDVTRTRNG